MNLSTKKHRLKDIAEVERARKGQIYPTGTVYVQVSATRGQLHILKEPGEIEGKYATIIPKIRVYPLYFLIALERAMPRFLARYQTTINIQMENFEHFEIELHEDYETQMEIAEIMRQCDRVCENEEKIIEALKSSKKMALGTMFV